MTTARCSESLGSGFIVDAKGYIITNNHVVEKADKIYVKLSTDPDAQDLGVPRALSAPTRRPTSPSSRSTPARRCPPSSWATPNAQVGDWVEAIGSPFALSQTVTAGIVSAKNRTIEPGAARPVPALHSD